MPVLKSEQVSVVSIQGENAVFTKDELKSTKYAHETGITILAFLDEAKFDQFKWFRSGGYFLYPDEDKWSGSKDFFACLLRRCLVLKVNKSQQNVLTLSHFTNKLVNVIILIFLEMHFGPCSNISWKDSKTWLSSSTKWRRGQVTTRILPVYAAIRRYCKF